MYMCGSVHKYKAVSQFVFEDLKPFSGQNPTPGIPRAAWLGAGWVWGFGFRAL